MTDSPARVRRSKVPLLTLEVTPDRIRGRFRGGVSVPGQVALVLDGAPLATLRTEAFGLEWTLPADVFGRLLEVVSVPTGAPLLDEPFRFESVRHLSWGGWARRGRTVEGWFTIRGDAAPPVDLALPVAFLSGDVPYGQCFAVPSGSGTYQFAGAVDRLPPSADGVAISAKVGSAVLPETLRVPASAFDHIGFAEPAEPWRARGWVVAPSDPGRRVRVDLLVEGRRVASAVANRMREDVATAGLGDGRAGFEVALPPSVPLDRPVLVDVRVAPDGPSLAGSPYLRPAAPPYLGFFDGVDGAYATGWVLGVARPTEKIRVEAVCDGAVIGSGLADLYRGDVEEAGLPSPRCGFHFPLAGSAGALLGRDIVIRIAGTGHILQGSPRQVTLNPNITRFLQRGQAVPPAVLDRLARLLTHRTRNLLVSIVMPVHETRRDWLVAAVESVRAQWSGNWELICVDDGSRAPEVQEVLAGYARADQRIRVLRTPDNGGIARAVNFGLRAARGEYVAFMDHDDTLEPDAVYHLAQAARTTGADLLYSDEALTGPDIDDFIEVRARPAFSHDFYLSHPYFVHMVCVRTALAQALAGYDETLPISADVDFVLRAIEGANAVAHIPRVLYRWRTHAGSAGHARQAEVMSATRTALARHLRRLGHAASVRDGPGFNQFHVDWPDDGGEILIVIPTRNRVELLRSCIDSIERTAPGEACRIVVIDHQSTDPKTIRYLAEVDGRHTVIPYKGAFNFARMNNEAVRRHGGQAGYVLFLNNDVEAAAPGWLGRLRSLAGRQDVGAVGPLLLYGNRRVQHAGVVVGFSGAADHAMKLADAFGPDGARNPGYNCNLTSVRDFSAVTAACMMLRREVFTRFGGFDERFAVGFNDTDLCLRLREAGLKVLYDGHTALYHHESATRTGSKAQAHPEDDERLRTHWRRYFTEGDPFYSPMLNPAGTDHVLRADGDWEGRMQVRTVALTRQAPAAQTRAWATRSSSRVSTSG